MNNIELVELHQALDIPESYRRGRKIWHETRWLMNMESHPVIDIYDRQQRMSPPTGRAWQRMQRAAQRDGVLLQLVSAFRSWHYQAGIVQRKRLKGQSWEQIFAVTAAPGFSEHHSGRALDLTTPESPTLEIEFEQTDAYCWLQQYAARYHFYLSFPRNSQRGVTFEPWHWLYCPR